MRIMGCSYYKEFRKLKPSKEALQRELKIDDEELCLAKTQSGLTLLCFL
jgi:hypothetical protein